MSETNKPADGGTTGANTTIDSTKYVPKEELEKVSATVKDLEAKLDEAKLSLLDPEYISFLESKKGKDVKDKVVKATDIDDRDLDKLSSRELLQLSVERATEAVRSELGEKYEKQLKGMQATLSDVLAVFELQECEKRFKDFGEFRDDTKKILETSSTPLTIEQAYKLAKQNRADKDADTNGSEKTVRKTASEKPGGTVATDEFVTKTFKNKQDAAEDAWDQVMGAGKETL